MTRQEVLFVFHLIKWVGIPGSPETGKNEGSSLSRTMALHHFDYVL